VATDFDRDDRLHGQLRETLRSQPASGPCLDAATLAAWAEGALTPEETAATDAHLAACARCRELAATLSTMAAELAPAAEVVPFAPRTNRRWQVIVGAVGAVAASVLIWVAVRDGSPSLDTTSAANRAAAEDQARGMGGNAVPPATAPARPAESASALQPRADAERLQGQQGRPAQLAPAAPLPETKFARAAEPGQNAAKPSAAPVEPPARATAPPPPAVMPPPPAAPPPAAGAARSSTVAGLPQSTINIAIDPSRQVDAARSTETFFAIPPPIIAEFVAGADLQLAQGQQRQGFGATAAAGGRGGGGGGGGRGAGAAGGVPAQKAADVLSTQPLRWRLREASPAPSTSIATLERSNDGGVTWRSVTLPATPLLSGGTAPTNMVCWLVGRAGTVLLSTDGTTFRQVTKPADADLVSVRAVDARSATVRTADGRTFVTIDGGTTWTTG